MKDFFEKYADRIAKAGPNDCWLWTGSHTAGGYGNLTRDNESHYAHRSAYASVHGHADGVVRHRCDNPPCVNPNHLEIGTHSDNMRDAIERGRTNFVFGEHAPSAILSEQQVLAAREIVRNGGHIAPLARELGISHNALTSAVIGETWGHLPGAVEPPGLRKGEDCQHAILTTHDVLQIRARIKNGEGGSKLAREYGVHPATISAVKHGRIWRHV